MLKARELEIPQKKGKVNEKEKGKKRQKMGAH